MTNCKLKSLLCILAAIGCSLLQYAQNCTANPEIKLTEKQFAEVGRKIWRNECGGSVEGLTSWNAGEEFPSLGIGHFIWYPEGVKGPFDESFPRLLAFLENKGITLPNWLSASAPCPWKSRAEFLEDRNSKKMIELREMLSSTVAEQTDFIVRRLENALPKMLEQAPLKSRSSVQKRFESLLKSGNAGVFALIDYVNFKGEGVLATERYKGEGWGMLQVLQEMADKNDPVQSFVDSAKEVLKRRVRNSPPARNEERWLPGWLKRVNNYVCKT